VNPDGRHGDALAAGRRSEETMIPILFGIALLAGEWIMVPVCAALALWRLSGADSTYQIGSRSLTTRAIDPGYYWAISGS
jgi:hypothetical protein